MNKTTDYSLRQYLAPRFWLTWLGIGALVLIAWLPHKLRLLIGKQLGLLVYFAGKERRVITATNIRLCFPELDKEEQALLVKKSFIANGTGLIETGAGWIRSSKHFSSMVKYKNLELLLEAQAKGKGVLLLGAHYSTLDLGANLLSIASPFAVSYKPHKNPLFNAFMYQGRARNCTDVFDRYDIRGMFRHLKRGNILWYAPDQDYGPKHAVYVPFFGQTAATITAPSRLAKFNDSETLLIRQNRKEKTGHYELTFFSLPSSYPTGDDITNASVINEALEKAIRYSPEQYLWMHKRFKTQQGGKPDSPYIEAKTSFSKLDQGQFETIMEGSSSFSTYASCTHSEQIYSLQSGFYGRLFNGLASRRFKHHPAWQVDKASKQLRLKGINTITADKIFRIKDTNQTLLSCFMPEGTPLGSALTNEHIDNNAIEALGGFFLHCHNNGVSLVNLSLSMILVSGNSENTTFSVSHPENVRFFPTDLSMHDRADDLIALKSKLSQNDTKLDTVLEPAIAHYLKLNPYSSDSHLKQRLVMHFQL